MTAIWKLQDAKAHFSRLVKEALEKGPQMVTRRGEDAVVVLSAREYAGLVSGRPDFRDFLLSCPKVEGVCFDRHKDYPRNVDL